MEITRVALLQRRAELAETVKNSEANLYAQQGALQDTEYWLEQLGVEETPPKDE